MRTKILHLFLLASVLMQAQITISFEENEGYTLGNINNQQGWKTFNIPDDELIEEYIDQQDVTDEYSTVGGQALKISSIETFPDDYDGEFGAYKDLETQVTLSNHDEISFDVLIDEIDHSDYYIDFFQLDENTEATGGVLLGFYYEGDILVVEYVDEDYETVETGHYWQPNIWMHCVIRIENNHLQYFVNDTLVRETPVYFNEFNSIMIDTDSYGGHLFIDNIQINSSSLGVTENDNTSKVKLVQNQDEIKIHGLNTYEHFEINVFDASGTLLYQPEAERFNTSHLPSGIYYLTAKTKNKIIKFKFLKK